MLLKFLCFENWRLSMLENYYFICFERANPTTVTYETDWLIHTQFKQITASTIYSKNLIPGYTELFLAMKF